MWSGPRNISTALLRAWENRPDTWVVDEPLYAHYLTQVAVTHPAVNEVIARHQTDWVKVVEQITGPIPAGRAIYYQKHMAHHWLPHLRGAWVLQLTNAFLIRHPAEMLPSLVAKMGPPTLRDTGLPQQLEIFEMIRTATGRTPPVLDAEDVLRDPRGALSRFCAAVSVPFSDRMLSWPPGRRPTDGVWAKYWYEAVEQSTGFERYTARPRSVTPDLEPLLAECLPLYEALRAHRIMG
jgi:hypothetical protein